MSRQTAAEKTFDATRNGKSQPLPAMQKSLLTGLPIHTNNSENNLICFASGRYRNKSGAVAGSAAFGTVIGDAFTKANIRLVAAALARRMKREGCAEEGLCVGYL